MVIRILYIFLILLLTSCEELEVDEDSIFEADPSEQIPDIINLHDSIGGNSADFSWEGNDFALEFSYMLEMSMGNSLNSSIDSGQFVDQSYFHWSEWTTEKNMGFYNLDEAAYTFYVKSRFDPWTEEEEPHNFVEFEIDNIDGPALRIYPLNQTANTGDEIDVYLYFEEVPIDSAVTGLHVEIQIDQNELEFITDDFDYGELIDGFPFPGTTIYPNPQYSMGADTMSIVGVVVDSSGTGIYGTGSIAKFRLRVLASAGTYNIDIGGDGTFLDMDGEPIEFDNPVSGSVTVE